MTIPGRTQAYGAGNKTYGFGRSNPTSGPVDKLGYRERNLSQNTFQSALARRSTTAGPQGSQSQVQPQQSSGQPQAAATNTGTIGTSIAPMHTQQSSAPVSQVGPNTDAYGNGPNGGTYREDAPPKAPQNNVSSDYANPAGPNQVAPGVQKWITDNNPGSTPGTLNDPNTKYSNGSSGVTFSNGGATTIMPNHLPWYGEGAANQAQIHHQDALDNPGNYNSQGVYIGAQGTNDFSNGKTFAQDDAFYNNPANVNNQAAYQEYMSQARNSLGFAQAPGGGPLFHGTPQMGSSLSGPSLNAAPQVGGSLQNSGPSAGTPQSNLSNMGDVEYQNALARLASAHGQANMQYATGVNDVNTSAYQSQRGINQQAPLIYEALLNKFAGRGMAHSGRYAQDYGTAQEDTADQLYNVDNQKNNQLNQLLQQLTGANQQYDFGTMDANQSLAQRLAAQAGKLGLDKTTKDPVAPQFSSGEHGGLDRPLPARSKAIDKSITSIPSNKWTDRQTAYAAKYNLQGKR